MRAGGIAGAARVADDLPLPHRIAARHVYLAQVRVQRVPAVAVIEDDEIAIALRIPPGVDRHAGVRRVQRVAQLRGDVEAGVPRRVEVAAGEIVTVARPGKTAAARRRDVPLPIASPRPIPRRFERQVREPRS